MQKPKNLDFKIVKMRARELRSKAIPTEILLWKELRNRKLSGYKFLRRSRNWIMCTPLFTK